jgi:hypothetical protein
MMPTGLLQLPFSERLLGSDEHLAHLRLAPSDFTARHGIQFVDEPDDPGLGPYQYALVETSSGVRFALVRHTFHPLPGTELHVGGRVDPRSALAAFLAAADLTDDALEWRLREPIELAIDSGNLDDSAKPFAASIDRTPASAQAEVRRLLSWAQALESSGLAVLKSYSHERMWTLLPCIPPYDAVLTEISWYSLGVQMRAWRPDLLRHAPGSLPRLEQCVPHLSHSFSAWAPTDREDVLDALTAGYREAASNSS